MLTSNDIQKLTDVFTTRAEFEQKVETLVTKEEFQKATDQLYNLVDQVLGEVKTMRMEQMAHHQEHEDLNIQATRLKSYLGVSDNN